MIFEKIILDDFGPFYGSQLINTDIKKDKNVTIIHAQNYVGKTSILRAIIWCLYGKVIEDDHGTSVLILNSQAESEGKNKCSVRIIFMHNDEKYDIMREFNTTDNGTIINVFKTDKYGHNQPLDNPTELINEIAPLDLSKFFFLKGENSPLNSKESNLQDSLKKILGFHYLEKANSDLASINNDIQKEIGKIDQKDQIFTLLGKNINNLKEEANTLEKNENILKDKIDFLSLKKDQLTNEIDNAKILNEKQERLSDLTQQIEKKKETLKKKNRDKIDWCRKGIHSLLGNKLEISGIEKIDEDIHVGKLPGKYQSSFIDEILSKKICICDRCFDENSKEFHSIKKLKSNAGDERVFHAMIEAKAVLNSLSSDRANRIEEFNLLTKEIETIEQDIDKDEEKKDELKDFLKNCNDIEINEKIEKYHKLEKDIEDARHQLVKTSSDLNKKNNDLSINQKEFDNLAMSKEEARALLKYREFVSDVIFNLKNSTEKMQERAKREIASQMMEIVKNSLTEYPEIVITDKFTYDIGDYYLAGGPKRILDFAFTASILNFNKSKSDILMNSGGIIIPLVIDSAFGETDEDYRKALAQFLPQLSPQLIVLISGTQGHIFTESIKDKINNEYLIVREIKEPQGNSNIGKITIDDVHYQTKFFDKDKEQSIIRELKI